MEECLKEVIPLVLSLLLFSTRLIAFEFSESNADVCISMHYSKTLPGPPAVIQRVESLSSSTKMHTIIFIALLDTKHFVFDFHVINPDPFRIMNL